MSSLLAIDFWISLGTVGGSLLLLIYEAGACGLIIIVVGNGHGDPSSNPGRGFYISHSANTLWEQ